MIRASRILTYPHTAPIGSEAWLRIIAVGLLAFFAVGTEKWIRARWGDRPA